jgi:NAD-dependent deacetylase
MKKISPEIFTNLPKDASIVILTGAGISAESGLATFRGDDGLWEGHRVEDVATPEAFARDPDLVHNFYNMRREGLQKLEIKPNPAHTALAKLEQSWPKTNGGDTLIVTQNIDNLHERGGSQNIIHMHGEALRVFCQHCGHNCEWTKDLETSTLCPSCNKTHGLRPDIVWFGEMPYHMDKIYRELQDCDLFISIGTSGHVYPAAGFVNEARMSGAITIEFNLEPSNVASAFEHHVHGPAGTTIPEFVETLLKMTD